MLVRHLFLWGLVTLNFLVDATSVPPIPKCKAGDGECALKAAIDLYPTFIQGIPEYGIQNMDPLHLDTINASTPSLNMVLTNVTISGLKNCLPVKILLTEDTSKLITKFMCGVSHLDGNYEMDGQLLIPIRGKGQLHVKLRKLTIGSEADIEDKIGKDGKKHWTIKRFKHTHEIDDKADIQLTNLFHGNQLLEQAAQGLLSSADQDAVFELGGPAITAAIKKVLESIKRYFSKIPSEEFLINEN